MRSADCGEVLFSTDMEAMPMSDATSPAAISRMGSVMRGTAFCMVAPMAIVATTEPT